MSTPEEFEARLKSDQRLIFEIVATTLRSQNGRLDFMPDEILRIAESVTFEHEGSWRANYTRESLIDCLRYLIDRAVKNRRDIGERLSW